MEFERKTVVLRIPARVLTDLGDPLYSFGLVNLGLVTKIHVDLVRGLWLPDGSKLCNVWQTPDPVGINLLAWSEEFPLAREDEPSRSFVVLRQRGTWLLRNCGGGHGFDDVLREWWIERRSS